VSGVRVGVDVGGTFTKAVAVDLDSGEIVGRAVVPTTHADARGVAAGVVRTVAEVVRSVGAERVDLVTHSTTQAVNALLEGDVGTVGVLGLGRRPELKQARKRTQLERVELSPGRFLRTLPEFLDVSDGLDEAAVHDVLARFRAAGATAVSVAEAFAPDDSTFERRVTAMANEAGLPACASSELTGLYGLELRAVTAALNASILPVAERTAEVVAVGVEAAGVAAPVMVMRGDGGATDLDGFRRAPARTLYSGPAASVAGALRFAGVAEGVVVEVGGTSTNVAAVKRGRPLLSYVQVASHSTALRAVDVRVIGVAGGSMLRARKGRVYGVGPRSGHIAGLPYACFIEPDRLVGARGIVVTPREGDSGDHLVLQLADGSRAAVTVTCAANALGIPEPGDHAWSPTAHDAGVAAAVLQPQPAHRDHVRRRTCGYSIRGQIDAVVQVSSGTSLLAAAPRRPMSAGRRTPGEFRPAARCCLPSWPVFDCARDRGGDQTKAAPAAACAGQPRRLAPQRATCAVVALINVDRAIASADSARAISSAPADCAWSCARRAAQASTLA
jgi:hypothetical protein